jgi:hypothetical protein
MRERRADHLLAFVVSVEICPPQGQTLRPRTKVMDWEVSQRGALSPRRRHRPLVEDNHCPMTAWRHVRRKVQVDPGPAVRADDNVGFNSLHTPLA